MKLVIILLLILLLILLFSGKGKKMAPFYASKVNNDKINLEQLNEVNDFIEILKPFFSELDGKEILLKELNISTTLAARPSFSPLNLFKRRYEIVFNTDKNFSGMKFEALSKEAKIGILAHELSHIVEYEKMNNLQLFIYGLKYLTKSGKKKIEKHTDELVVRRGFGKYLKVWADIAMYSGPGSENYKEFKRNNYLNPAEIDSLMSLGKTN